MELNWIDLHFQQMLLHRLAFSLQNSYSTNAFAFLQAQSKVSMVDCLLEEDLVVHTPVLLVDMAWVDSQGQKDSL